MSLYRELVDSLPFDPTERDGLWGYRSAHQPHAVRTSFACGAAFALCLYLASRLGLIAPVEWGMALFCGLTAAVIARGVLQAQHRLRHGGWQTWRRRQVDERAIDRVSGGTGIILALLLATGGGGVGPAFALGEALFIGILAVIVSRAFLMLIRWP